MNPQEPKDAQGNTKADYRRLGRIVKRGFKAAERFAKTQPQEETGWRKDILEILKSDHDDWGGITWTEDEAQEKREAVIAKVRSLLSQTKARVRRENREKIKRLKVWSAEEAMYSRLAPEMFLDRNEVFDSLIAKGGSV